LTAKTVSAKTKQESDDRADSPEMGLSDTRVRDYLKDNPDFFDHHPDMLDHLQITHKAGSAVSLVEKQVSVLRERNMEMRKRLNSLTGNARENDRLYELTRQLVLSLLEARSLEELGETFCRGLREDFGVDHVSFILFGESRDSTEHCRIESAERARIEIGALIKGQNAVCGTLREEELQYLFPDSTGVGSAAVVPLVRGGDLGVIAVGSEDPHYYSASTGTLFLGHLGEVVVRLLPRLRGDQAGA
jgi:uncharacterized protein YigA (DUF484 family)